MIYVPNCVSEEAEKALSPDNRCLQGGGKESMIKDYVVFRKWQSRPVLSELKRTGEK